MKKIKFLKTLLFSFILIAIFSNYSLSTYALNMFSYSSIILPKSTTQKNITLNFSSQISKGTNFNKIKVYKGKAKTLKTKVEIENKKINITINESLVPGVTYTLLIPSNSVKDNNGSVNREIKIDFKISQNKNLSGRITIAGSTSVQPLADELAKYFMQLYPKVTIDVQGGGSSVGIKSAKEGIADIGTSSRELKPDETGLKEFKIAEDGIAIVVNPKNPISDLTVEKIRDIFSGKIKNWSELGGKNSKILVVTREEGSGTRGAFEEIIMGKTTITNNAVVQPSTGAVKTTVSQDENAIGYISLGVLDSQVKAVKVNGVEATEKNARLNKYTIKRPFLFLTKTNPTGVVKEFIDFVLSPEGQAIVSKNYITVK
ncbi:phosphate ABC transporter substrate-binding protein PstS family protein [Caldicellulosiruptoraceae bacterium PP1]